MVRIDIAPDAGDAVVRHVYRHFMDNNGYDIRHGYKYHFHRFTFRSIAARTSVMSPDSEKESLS